MNTVYMKKIELAGIEVMNCKTQKEFLHEMQNYTNYHGKEYCSETKYMNTNSDSYYDSIAGGSVADDVCINIWYTDGTSYSYYPALGIDGKFKKTGIKSAIISDGYGFLIYNYDLSEEWENIKETLTEEEENAIENGISIENFKIAKALQAEAQEQEQEQEQTQEEKSSFIPSDFLFTPSDFLAKPEFKIDILGALKEAGYNTGYIRKHKIFPESTVQKFRNGNTDISINTLFRVCQILDKDISDVIKFKVGEDQEPEQEQEQEQEYPTECTKKGAEEETEVFPNPGEGQEPEQEQEQEQEYPTECTKKGEEEETEVFPNPGEGQEPKQEQEQEDPFENIKINIEIEKLNLFVRTYNILKRAGINTTSDLKKVDKRNLGKNTIAEIKNALQKLETEQEQKQTQKIDDNFLNSILIDIESEIAKLPDLSKTGSEKQIKWAIDIRRKAYTCLNDIIQDAITLYRQPPKGTRIYINIEQYEKGIEYKIGLKYYNSKQIVNAVHEIKKRIVDFFFNKYKTASEIIEEQDRIERSEIIYYVTKFYEKSNQK